LTDGGGFPNNPEMRSRMRRMAQRKAAYVRADPFRYHGPLELSEHAHHLKHGPPAGRGRIQPLGVQIKVNAEGVQFRKELD